MTRLRLKAEDAEDLEIISAHLQDSIARVGDIAYLQSKRRFALVLNRFMWEDLQGGDKTKASYRRVRTGLHFDGVLGVKSQNIRQDAKDAVLELLSVRFDPAGDAAGSVTLVFSGGGAIRLNVECLDAEISDISEPWSTKNKPGHETQTT
jgi:hypothetical protein